MRAFWHLWFDFHAVLFDGCRIVELAQLCKKDKIPTVLTGYIGKQVTSLIYRREMWHNLFVLWGYVTSVYRFSSEGNPRGCPDDQEERKVGGIRYETRSRGRLSPNSLAFRACEPQREGISIIISGQDYHDWTERIKYLGSLDCLVTVSGIQGQYLMLIDKRSVEYENQNPIQYPPLKVTLGRGFLVLLTDWFY